MNDMVRAILSEVRKELGWRREAGVNPRVHGNGMIQVDLRDDGFRRVHIWGHTDIPRQETRTAIHDHTFGFKSMILVGELRNMRYHVETGLPKGSHRVFTPRPREGSDTELVLDEASLFASVIASHMSLLTPGRIYVEEPGEFHETEALGPTATIMEKTRIDSVRVARVLVPVGVEPDNTFHRHVHDVEFLWRIVDEVLGV